MKRIYQNLIAQHFAELEQMLFFAGPRQVGKSTISMAAQALTTQFLYLNWDNTKHRTLILQDEDVILEKLDVNVLGKTKPILIFDEIHKYKDWKNYLKGFYDLYKHKINIIVCGSAKLDIYKKGGDSLMGRYLLYRVHPLSIREVVSTNITDTMIQAPIQIKPTELQKLLHISGYPEPYLKNNTRFVTQWRRLRIQQLLKEDIRELKHVEDIAQLELLTNLLCEQAGSLTKYSNLAKAIRVSNDTIRRWINILHSFYFCFKIQPWYKNVKRSLLKEPKIYLWDWTMISEPGARLENFVACHLLKAVHWWTDHGLGKFDLHFLRDKEKREVDFVVIKNNKPWFLVEVKGSKSQSLSKNLELFQKQISAPHAFQVVSDLDFIAQDCFNEHKPIKVPLSTFLSQLI